MPMNEVARPCKARLNALVERIRTNPRFVLYIHPNTVQILHEVLDCVAAQHPDVLDSIKFKRYSTNKQSVPEGEQDMRYHGGIYLQWRVPGAAAKEKVRIFVDEQVCPVHATAEQTHRLSTQHVRAVEGVDVDDETDIVQCSANVGPGGDVRDHMRVFFEWETAGVWNTPAPQTEPGHDATTTGAAH